MTLDKKNLVFYAKQKYPYHNSQMYDAHFVILTVFVRFIFIEANPIRPTFVFQYNCLFQL